ncbi:hypothetical protein I7I48_11122 [Histoplasma ohiense]|nr:hypothetical protein I7I48_11122 [Histoplasma ohiense (nom. inval.)]
MTPKDELSPLVCNKVSCFVWHLSFILPQNSLALAFRCLGQSSTETTAYCFREYHLFGSQTTKGNATIGGRRP